MCSKKSQQLCSDIFEFHGFTAENMIKLIAKNVKAESLRKLTECTGNKPNMWQIWLCGFEPTTQHPSTTQTIFLKLCKNCAHYKIVIKNLLFDGWYCLKLHQWVTPCTEKKIWLYILLRNYRSILPMHFCYMSSKFLLTWSNLSGYDLDQS